MVVDGRKNNLSHPGHRLTRKGEKIKFLHGTGCKFAPDCLECPRNDCTWDGSKWQGSTVNETRQDGNTDILVTHVV